MRGREGGLEGRGAGCERGGMREGMRGACERGYMRGYVREGFKCV